jgi:hypothetical protein
MIKSAKKEKYYGTLAYADGEIRKVISHVKEVTEDSDGIKHSEYWILKNFGYVSKIVSVEAYKIMTALDTVTAVVKVDGRTYIGHAQCNPSDQFDGAFGRKLALARAMHDHSMIRYLEELSNWSLDADGTDEDDDDDEEFISAGDVDGGDTLYCCHCGEPMDADGAIPDSYTDDIYCCQSCYLAAGGNIDPDGDDDDGDNNYCDYCLEDIPDGTNFVDADGHQYCCAECMQKALVEKDSDDEE